jgi:hypothetical protein
VEETGNEEDERDDRDEAVSGERRAMRGEACPVS